VPKRGWADSADGDVVLKYTDLGRRILATGRKNVAAENSGVKTRRIKFAAFLFFGSAAVLSGLLFTAMIQTARLYFGEGAELMVIAAVIFGRTSLFGGKGTILGTFAGSLLIGTINKGLIIKGLDVSEQMMGAGGIIILAVAFGKEPAI
jgi:ribose transport system permease protein